MAVRQGNPDFLRNVAGPVGHRRGGVAAGREIDDADLPGRGHGQGEEAAFHREGTLRAGHHHRCYPNRATVRYALLGRRSAEFVDFHTGEITLHDWLRSGCRCGHVLANGLVYRLPDHCQCYTAFQPRGLLALRAGEPKLPDLTAADRLVRGPAHDSPLSNDAAAEDWPTFRHEPFRSAMATCPLPDEPQKAWQVRLGLRLTAPVVAGGKVFVAVRDGHRLVALDARSGKQLREFTADGPIDSPPTFWRGRVLFGCRDGRIYCVQADDGQLAWRFLAAPDRRQIDAFGQLESAWPVAGSVLVAGGKVCAVAGRIASAHQTSDSP